MTIWARRGRRALLRVRRTDWDNLIGELGRRGRGDRESGAFLLAERDGDRRTVSRIVYFDDIDPKCLTGGIEIDGLAYSKLWDICDAEQRVVVGDVHTHPRDGVRQSGIDADNPMVAQTGHVALIVPRFATRAVELKEVGVHLYQGNGWRTWTGKSAAKKIFVRRLL